MVEGDAEQMSGEERAARLVPGMVWGVTVASAVAVQVGFVVWLYSSDAGLRRWWIGGCLAVLLVCVGVVGVNQLFVRRLDPRAALDVLRVTARRGAPSALLPASVPGALRRRAVGVLGRAGVATAVFTLLAMAGGDAVRPAQVERIHRAGGVIEFVEVVRVVSQTEHTSRKHADFYTGVVVANLRDERSGEYDVFVRGRVVVEKSWSELRPGGLIDVLYSPRDPLAGGICDDEAEDLERADQGYTMGFQAMSVWTCAWLFVLLWSVRSLVKARRSVRNLDGRTKALRVACAGWETQEIVRNGTKFYGYPEWRRTPLKVDTDLGVMHFFADASFTASVGRVLEEAEGWLCWQPGRGRKGWEDAGARALPAVLVLDEGLALHGRVYEEHFKPAEEYAETPGAGKAAVDPGRAVGLWWPRSVWGLAAPVGALVSWALAVVCAGALLVGGVAGPARLGVCLAGLALLWAGMCRGIGRALVRFAPAASTAPASASGTRDATRV